MPSEQLLDQRVGLDVGERLEQDVDGVQAASAPPGPAVQQVRPGHADDEQRRAAGERGHLLDEVEEGLLAPVDVVEHADDGLLGGRRLEQLAHRPGDLLGRARRVRRPEQPAQGGDDPRVRKLVELVGQLPDDLRDGPVGDAVAVGEAAALEGTRAVEAAEKLRDEPRLAHPGRPDDRDQPAGAGLDRLRERVAQGAKLLLAADHRHRREPPGLVGAHVLQLPGADGLALALEREVGQRLRDHRAPDALERGLAEQDLAGARGLLQPGCDVDRVAGRQSFLGAGDDLTGVDPRAQREGRAEVALELLVQRGDRVAQLGRRPHCAERVVFVQHRHAEDGHGRVADELLDAPAVPLDDRPHGVEEPAEHVPDALRVEPLAELGRADDVAEEHRDDPALRTRDRRGGGPALGAELELLGADVPTSGATGHVPSLRPPRRQNPAPAGLSGVRRAPGASVRKPRTARRPEART